MKKVYYAFLALMLPMIATAQPVMDSAEYYHVGQHFYYMFCTNVVAGPSGAMQTWDFTTLADSALVAVNVDTASAPANISMDVGGTIYYLDVNDTQTGITGIDMQVATLEYNPNALLVKHPVTYLDTASNAFTSLATAPPAIPGTGTSHMEADGYGTLITPQATFDNTLRVKSVHSEHDSSDFAEEFVDFISYLWYDSAHTFPIMRIDSIVGTGSLPIVQVSAAYFTTDTPTAGVKNVASAAASAAAHLDDNGLTLKTSLQQGHQYKIGLLNMNGQVVYINTFTASGGLEHFNINRQLPTGTYLLSLSEPNGSSKALTIKVFKQ
ncbi:MAG: hypothetical protein BGO69_09670 [Bacteroidetes bacterium 46-16]|nr:MAG: hypothetical protein BGO69_09670 [Bacteroidetes bacterium 46-16]